MDRTECDQKLISEIDDEFWNWMKRERVYQIYFETFVKWKRLEQHNKKISDLFEGKTIAIYGAGLMGELVCKDLVRGQSDVLYFIDRDKEGMSITGDDIPIYAPRNTIEIVDVIIVSVVPYVDQIIEFCENLRFHPVVYTIDEICEELEGKSI